MPWCHSSHIKGNVKVMDMNSRMLEYLPRSVLKHKKTLLELHANGNFFSYFPSKIFNLLELRVLSLEDNKISSVPHEIGYLKNLELLNLSKNEIVELSDNISRLVHLVDLNMSANVIQILPDKITNLINLKNLQINDTSLVLLPRDIDRLVSLESIDARENFLAELPESIGQCKKLTWIDFGCNDLRHLPDSFYELENLRELYIDSNSLIELPENLCPNLVSLDISNNRITFIPDGIGKLVHLKELVMENNKINFLPSSIGDLKNLQLLKLDGNSIEELPAEITKLCNLKEIHASKNKLKRLPENIDQMKALEVVNFDFNELKRLPDQICSCNSIKILSVAKNKLKFLPNELGKMSSLNVLDLCYNDLMFLPLSTRNLRVNALWLSKKQPNPIMKLQILNHKEYGKVLVCYLLPQSITKEPTTKVKEQKKSYISPDRMRSTCAIANVSVNPMIDEEYHIPDYPVTTEKMNATVDASQFVAMSFSSSSESSNTSHRKVLELDHSVGYVIKNTMLSSSDNDDVMCDNKCPDSMKTEISYFETRSCAIKSIDLNQNFEFPVKFKDLYEEQYPIFDRGHQIIIESINFEFIKTELMIRPGDRLLQINDYPISELNMDAQSLSEYLRDGYLNIISFIIRRDPPTYMLEKVTISTKIELYGGEHHNDTYIPLYINIGSNDIIEIRWLVEAAGEFLLYQPVSYVKTFLESAGDQIEALVFHTFDYLACSGFRCAKNILQIYRSNSS